jgi:hypothetical protein
MPNNPPPPDPRLTRRRPLAEELERMTTPEAMANAADEAEALWDRDSGLPGLLSAEPEPKD